MTTPTPTASPELAFRVGGFATLADGPGLCRAGRDRAQFLLRRAASSRPRCPMRELRRRAAGSGPRVVGSGLERGDRVAIVAETSPDFVSMFFACQYAGLVPVPLPLCINIGGHDAYVERLRGMLAAAGARAGGGTRRISWPRWPRPRWAPRSSRVATAAEIGGLAGGGPSRWSRSGPTSPATSSIRPAAPASRAACWSRSGRSPPTRSAIAVHGLELRPGDRCTSWLPLYHDMGLVGCCLTPVMAQITVDYLPSTAFARRPLLWLKLLSDLGGTISFGPTFGYELCTRRAQSGGLPEVFDLSRWRVAGIGGEMIRAQRAGRVRRALRRAPGSTPRRSCRATGWPRRRWP